MALNLVPLYNTIVNSLSFTNDLYKLRRTLNTRIDSPESIEEFPESHPQGFTKEFRRRRISMVESYLVIQQYLESTRHQERLQALRLLEDQTFHSRNLAMPLNTARVQLALMKEAVKNRDQWRRQVELLQDFSVSSYGQPSVIRRFLAELNIVELPEDGRRLREMDMGWDTHVHDNSSYGRKNASQLVIDAFIKGISKITVVFNLLVDRSNMEELLDAGRLMGVYVGLGVEFSVESGTRRFHYMYLLPEMSSKEELASFLETHKKTLAPFVKGLRRNQQNRIESISTAIESFNKTRLPILNDGYPENSVYILPPLKLSDTENIVPIENLNRMHLGELLYIKFKPILRRRVVLAKSRYIDGLNQFKRSQISEWDLHNIAARYETIRRSYVDLNPELLRETYFSNTQLLEYQSVFGDFHELADALHKTGGTIEIIHPLEHGIDAAYAEILTHGKVIDKVEIYNMHDSIARPVDEIIRFARFINILNCDNPEAVKPFLVGHRTGMGDEKEAAALRRVCGRSFACVCGSDATGRSTNIPGMGFLFESMLTGRSGRAYRQRHFTLPEPVSRFIKANGRFAPEGNGAPPVDPVLTMGKSTKFVPNKIGDEHESVPIPFDRAIRYLNPRIRNLAVVAVGFVIAWLTVGLGYAVVWFGITAIRHVVTDVLSRRGTRIREWTWRVINFRNMSYSLFWTGLSVPILHFVKVGFDLVWPFALGTILFNLAKFLAIALVNGVYLVFHNKLRGFDRGVIWANFFRSILSWPFASICAPVGDLLGIPTIVQAKFWSDFVGGFIEGTGKFRRSVAITRGDLTEMVESFREAAGDRKYTAALDILYIFEREPRARTSLREILFSMRGVIDRLGRESPDAENGTNGYREYDALLEWFGHASNYQKIAEYVIEHYQHAYALSLIELLARQYYHFTSWLESVKRLRGPDAGAAA